MNLEETKFLIWVINAIKKILRLEAVNTSSEQISEIMRRDLCNFQLHYTNYQFGASQKHKALKDALQKGDTGTNEYSSFVEFIERDIQILFGKVAKDIQEYFNKTHPNDKHPRITIYLVDENNHLVDLVMIPKSNCYPTNICIKDFTSMSEILKEGIPYLANNVPKEIQNDDSYRHPELNISEIKRNYKLHLTDRKPFALLRNNYCRTVSDREWNKMKIDKDKELNLHKSHLVIPITYRAHLDQNFLDTEMVKILGLEKERRSILGFICVDHSLTYYFNDEPVETFRNIDINIMYVYADLLSLIIVKYLIYTSGSSTYSNFSAKN